MATASKIEEFLRNAPQGRLYVVVGYADVTGLAWLERHAAERPITLLIGDTRGRLFRGQPQDRRAALDLLARTDVDVLSGYRQGAPLVHQKVFVVASPGGDQAVAGLVGSGISPMPGSFVTRRPSSQSHGRNFPLSGSRPGASVREDVPPVNASRDTSGMPTTNDHRPPPTPRAGGTTQREEPHRVAPFPVAAVPAEAVHRRNEREAVGGLVGLLAPVSV